MEMPQVEIAETAVKNAVDDGQPSRKRGQPVHETAFAGLAVFCHGFLEGVSREPPGVAMRGLTVGGGLVKDEVRHVFLSPSACIWNRLFISYCRHMCDEWATR